MEIFQLRKPCLIIGCGSHSYAVISIIESLDEYAIKGLVDTAGTYDSSESKSGYHVITSLGHIEKNYRDFSEYSFAVAVGSNKARADIYEKLNKWGLKTPNFISSNAFVDPSAIILDGNIIAHKVVINAQARIGDNNLVNTSAVVEHNAVVGNNNHLGPLSVMCGNTKLGDTSFIGAGSVILPSISLGNHCTLGARATLTKDCNLENSVLVGTPARII